MAGCQYKIYLDLRVVSVTLCYTADKLEPGKNISNQENVRENCGVHVLP